VGDPANSVENKVHNGCDKMFDKVQVTMGNDYAYPQNGRSLVIRFVGVNGDPGQYEMVSSDGETPLTGENITFYSNTTIPYG